MLIIHPHDLRHDSFLQLFSMYISSVPLDPLDMQADYRRSWRCWGCVVMIIIILTIFAGDAGDDSDGYRQRC